MGRIDLTGKHQLIVETVREWMALLVAVIFSCLFAVSAFKMYRTLQAVKFDLFILLAGLLEMILILINEFAYYDARFNFMILNLEVFVMSIMFYKFISVYLRSIGLRWVFKKILFPLNILVFAILLTNIILAFVYYSAKGCEFLFNKAHWLIISSFGMLLAIANGFLSFYIGKRINIDKSRLQKNEEIGDELEEVFEMRNLQLKILVWGYLVVYGLVIIWYSCVDIFVDDGSIKCVRNSTVSYWAPANEGAAFYLLVSTVLFFVPSLNNWVVFYWIPYRGGQIVQKIVGEDIDLKNDDYTRDHASYLAVSDFLKDDMSKKSDKSNNPSISSSSADESMKKMSKKIKKTSLIGRSMRDNDA